MSYTAFADYYDALTRNVEYEKRADYLCRLWDSLGHDPGITLDLACGTGSLTLALAQRGIDVYGVDGSPEMLSVAQQKAVNAGRSLLFCGPAPEDAVPGFVRHGQYGGLRLGQHQSFNGRSSGAGCL